MDRYCLQGMERCGVLVWLQMTFVRSLVILATIWSGQRIELVCRIPDGVELLPCAKVVDVFFFFKYRFRALEIIKRNCCPIICEADHCIAFCELVTLSFLKFLKKSQ